MSRIHRDMVLTIILLLTIAAIAGTLVYVMTKPKSGAYYTEFYILDTRGGAKGYPQLVALDTSAPVLLGVVNHEHKSETYTVAISINGEPVGAVQIPTLKTEEKWETETSFTPTKAGLKQKVEFALYRQDGTNPYRTLYLWIDVLAGVRRSP